MRNNDQSRITSDDTTLQALWQPVSRRRALALAGGAMLFGACSDWSAEKPSTGATATGAGDSVPSTDVASSLNSSTTGLPSPTTVPAPVGPVAPLTGRPVTDSAMLSRVALVVKVSNDTGARPQTGLNDADIIFEAWGAGPTRFATVWHSTDADFVGPIRSCREQDVNLVGGFNRAVFACSGGNPGNIALLRASDLLLIKEGQGPGWELDPTRNRPHKTHANTALLRSNAGPDRSGPSQQFRYRAEGQASTAGLPISGFNLQIQQVLAQWRYDASTATYLRSQDHAPHVLADGKQVSTENVVVMWLDYVPSRIDSRSPAGNSTGTNAAMVFTGGRLIGGTWSRSNRLDPFVLTDTEGAPILLTPGRTFVELPNSGKGIIKGKDTFTPVV